MDFKKNKPDIRHYCQPLRQQQTMKEEEEEQDVGKDTTQLKPEKRRHVFRFRIQFKKYEVTCDASMTVLEALLSNKNFKGDYKKNEEKEMVIQREKVPRGAISTDFPCCLINDDELLDIQFIKSSGSSSLESKPVPCSLMNSTENFIVFNIKTTGGHTVKRLMKNQALKQKVDDVCVYALKGETVKKALRRDGRFNRVIFRKHCGLYELGSEIITDMSNTVDHLDGKHFRVIVIDNQPASQESSQEFDTMKNESGENIPSTSTPGNLSQDSANPQQQNHQPTEKEKDKKTYPKRIQVNKIPNTEEILKLLRDQFEGLQKQLKERESLTKPAEVQEFFREEFDKSAQSFSEVKRVRQLMKLSDSVCQIRVEGFGNGTGFLLFDRFILTNAHVIGNFDPFTQRLHRPISAVFDFEDLDMGNKLSLKENLVAYFYGKNDKGQHLDFALLELSDDAKLPYCPELLSRYSPPPTRGGICIVGHPDGGVKRMDPCFIIEKDEVPNAADEHQAKNSDFLHVITQQCLAEKWENHYSQISYDSCFFHGSSGSPVFNDHCELIGVHTGGYVYKGKGGKTRSVMEYAFPMLPILVCIVRQCWQKGRSDILQYFEDQNNMKYVLQVANEQ
ncbi:protein FAM111A-like [Pygocentrus nattereri]|uniref:protein FAM111A-like n=1 Tax=Pygocentrus nattereri TaxID=42514 RepID=UPI0018912CF5|nr:protein FAM111A-like [Pygocentrus nattereri]